jgi:hypothetical protein
MPVTVIDPRYPKFHMVMPTQDEISPKELAKIKERQDQALYNVIEAIVNMGFDGKLNIFEDGHAPKSFYQRRCEQGCLDVNRAELQTSARPPLKLVSAPSVNSESTLS